jgi:hypothetical protein
MQNKINEMLGSDVKKILPLETLLKERAVQDGIETDEQIKSLLKAMYHVKMHTYHYYEWKNHCVVSFNNEEMINLFYNKALCLYKNANNIAKFTDDVLEALGVTEKQMAKILSASARYGVPFVIKRLNLYILFASNPNKCSDKSNCFGIKHGKINLQDTEAFAFDDPLRSGYGCIDIPLNEYKRFASRGLQEITYYNLTSDSNLSKDILNEIKNNQFSCEIPLAKSGHCYSPDELQELSGLFKRLNIKDKEFIKQRLQWHLNSEISQAMNIQEQEEIIDTALYKVNNGIIIFTNGKYSIDGLPLNNIKDYLDNKYFIDSIIAELKEGNAVILKLNKKNN